MTRGFGRERLSGATRDPTGLVETAWSTSDGQRNLPDGTIVLNGTADNRPDGRRPIRATNQRVIGMTIMRQIRAVAGIAVTWGVAFSAIGVTTLLTGMAFRVLPA